MVNVGLNFVSLLGLVYLALAILYPVLVLPVVLTRRRAIAPEQFFLSMVQAIVAPVLLFVSGLILLFQGWRLDPLLQFAQFLTGVLVVLLTAKDLLGILTQR